METTLTNAGSALDNFFFPCLNADGERQYLLPRRSEEISTG